MKVPLIHTTPPPEFGELKETPEFNDPARMDRDFTYVPGFSELRRERDLAISEVLAGKRAAKDVPTLPRNFRWARCQSKKGEPDSRKVIRSGNRGYKPVTKDDVGPGKLLPSLPGGAVAMPDGTIRQGDTMLMVATAADAARNEFNKRVRVESMEKGAIEGFASAMRSAGLKSVTGATPTTEKHLGPTENVKVKASK